MMRVIRAAHLNPRAPQSAGQGTNYRSSPYRPNATPRGAIKLNNLCARHFKSSPHVANKCGFALGDRPHDRGGREKTW
jgi:hypothetical protein